MDDTMVPKGCASNMRRDFVHDVFLPVSLAVSLALIGGCSYSASSTSETSVGINVDGKPQVNASASMNVEQSTDGKTVNQKTSVNLDSLSGSGFSHQQTKTRSEDGLQYVVENVVLRKGETEIFGFFAKEGTSDVHLKDVVLSFRVTNGKKMIWSDEAQFNNVNISVRHGERKPHTFVVTNPEAPAYDGPFDFDYTLNY